MPLYCYKCGACGRTEDMVRRSVARDVPLDCVPHCSGLMERDIASELPRSTQVEYQKEVYSDAAGCAPSQVKEHRRLHPDIKITNDGRVVMTSHRQRQKVLKRLGMKDHDSYY